MESGNAQSVCEEIVGTLTRKIENLFVRLCIFLNISDHLLNLFNLVVWDMIYSPPRALIPALRGFA